MYLQKRINDPSPREAKGSLIRKRSAKLRAFKNGRLFERRNKRFQVDQMYHEHVARHVKEYAFIADLDPDLPHHESLPLADANASMILAEALIENRLVRRKIIDPKRVSYSLKVVDA